MSSSHKAVIRLTGALLTTLLSGCVAFKGMLLPGSSNAGVKAGSKTNIAAGLPPTVTPKIGNSIFVEGDVAAVISNDSAGVISNDGAGVISNDGAGVISNDGAGVISNDSAGVISNDNAGVISNDSAGLLNKPNLSEQRPVTGAVVRAYRASGELVDSSLGNSSAAELVLSATTDASGHFKLTLPGDLAGEPLVLRATLPRAAGSLESLSIPRKDGTRDTHRTDVLTTLSTIYILDKFVKGQTDPNEALRKLPSHDESRAREVLRGALNDGFRAKVRTRSQAVAAIDALRCHNPKLNLQLDRIHSLLLGAGQANLGECLPATQVVMSQVNAIALNRSGLFVSSLQDRRIWRIGRDGRAETYVGKGGNGTITASIDGVSGPDISMGGCVSMAIDRGDRLVVAESSAGDNYQGSGDWGRVYRLNESGRAQELWRVGPNHPQLPFLIFADGHSDSVNMLTVSGDSPDGPSEHWLLGAGGEAQRVRSLSKRDSNLIANTEASGYDGRFIYLVVPEDDSDTVVYRYEPAAYSSDAGSGFLQIASRKAEALDALTVTSNGAIVAVKSDRSVELREPSGASREILRALPAKWNIDRLPASLDQDGNLYFAINTALPLPQDTGGEQASATDSSDTVVYRVRSGYLERVAGADGRQGKGDITSLPLFAPSGVAVAPDGRMFISDEGRPRISVVDSAGKSVETFAGTGESGNSPDGQIAAAARLLAPTRVRVNVNSQVYWVENDNLVRTVDADGKLITLYSVSGTSRSIRDIVPTPTGDGVYLIETDTDNAETERPATLVIIRKGETVPKVLCSDPRLGTPEMMAVGPDGKVYLAGQFVASGEEETEDSDEMGRLSAWDPSSGQLTVIANDSRFSGPGEPGLAVDARGRVYVNGTLETSNDNVSNTYAILQFDPQLPVSNRFRVLTGPRGVMFKGGDPDSTVEWPLGTTFNRAGDLLFIENTSRQVKVIPSNQL